MRRVAGNPPQMMRLGTSAGADRRTQWAIRQWSREYPPFGAATGTPWSHPSGAQNWPIGRRTASRQRALMHDMRVIFVRILAG
jgi:hypothetical protein